MIAGSGIGVVIETVQAEGYTVIGLEGFDLDSTMIQPRLDMIFDVARAPINEPVAVAAEWGVDVWVDVVMKRSGRPRRRRRVRR